MPLKLGSSSPSYRVGSTAVKTIRRGTSVAHGFVGGNLSAASLYAAALDMVNAGNTAPTAGGTLTVNGVSLGSYDYAVRSGETLSSFTAADWFTSTEDTRSAWCVVNGNLTINSGVTFTPSVRKLFTVLVVNGNLTVNGTISMTARGANHSGTGNSGGATTAGNIRIITGTYSGVTDPQVPAAGGSALSGPGASSAGFTGNAGSGGGTGGGGTGAASNPEPHAAGGGAAGTSFSGGSGGGGCTAVATIGATTTAGRTAQGSGGAGGPAGSAFNVSGAGGAGNPGGAGCGTYGLAGSSGTGGVLIVICIGELSGSGIIASNGSNGGGDVNDVSCGGGGSGGGSVTVMYASDSSSITPTANGGGIGNSQFQKGGAGGAGTARKLALA